MAGLIAEAETAQDIAAAFNKFLEPVSEYGGDVTALIAELFGISSACRDLSVAVSDPRNQRRKDSISEDFRTVMLSLEYTFNDINRFFGDLDRPIYFTKREAYRGVWKEIMIHCQTENEAGLLARLKWYKEFLNDIKDIVLGKLQSTRYRDLRYDIEDVLEIQNARSDIDLSNLSLGTPTPRPRSFERVRPYGLSNDLPSARPSARANEARPRRPFGPPGESPRRRPHRQDSPSPLRRPNRQNSPSPLRYPLRIPSPSPEPPPRRRRKSSVPRAPSPVISPGLGRFEPTSPTVASSATTNTSSTRSSSRSSLLTTHWLPKVFGLTRPTTEFEIIGQSSACYDHDMPGASRKLDKEYEKLLELPFETSCELIIRLYLREADYRARILCKKVRGGRTLMQASVAITTLRVVRADSCLQLCHPRTDGSLKLWATLRFTSYERMILFYCSFLALKMQDENTPPRDLPDHFLKDEDLRFSAAIYDDGYEHILRVYVDRNSRGIRMQASVLKGPKKKMPVWTAFITYLVASPAWILVKKSTPKVIELRELQCFVFTDDYTPQVSPRGGHELLFAQAKDAEEFIDVIGDLALEDQEGEEEEEEEEVSDEHE